MLHSTAGLYVVSAIGQASKHASISQRVSLQQAALLDILKSDLLAQGLQNIFTVLNETTARTLGVSGASIWRFTACREYLELADRYDRIPDKHSSGKCMLAADYPAYFEALQRNRVISASDVQNDPRTIELAIEIENIKLCSILDATIWYAGENRGVICIESINERRDWAPDEQQFAGSIADLVALALENNHRREAQNRLSASEDQFSRVFWLSPDWMVITRLRDAIVLEVNESFERQSGYSAAEVVGRTAQEIELWVSDDLRQSWLSRGAAQGSVRGLAAELRLKSGEIRSFEIASERIELSGEPCLITISRDVTASKRQERLVYDIAQSVGAASGEAFFRTLVECLARALDADMVFVGELDSADKTHIHTIDVQKKTGAAPNFVYELHGSPCESVLGRGICAYPRDVARLFPRDEALAAKGIEGYVGAPLTDSSGKALGLIAALFTRPLDMGGTTVHMLQIFAARAAAELERRNHLLALEHRATHDMLTGLINRAALERKINSSIEPRNGKTCALLLIDLDRFKEINDTLGHAVGDRLLVRLAKRLATENEAGSICRGAVARLGGDEFAIWLDTLSGPSDAEFVASRVLAALIAPVEIDDYRLEVGASIGIAVITEDNTDANEMVRRADVAMYVSKRRGDGYAVYDGSDDSNSRERLTLIGEIGEAVRCGQFELEYQPKVNLQAGIPTGFEALARWRHPRLGLLQPGQFIPLAELSDVIRPLTLWVLDQALAQLNDWRRDGYNLRMAVNLSARHLMDDACPDQIRRLLEKHDVPAGQLELEITESALIADPVRATQVLTRIHDMGVCLSIDDFGTGYSSLSHLMRLPLNSLKIDMSFVLHMLTNPKCAAIVESTINLAHNLGLSVVAEGIESSQVQSALCSLGCDDGQGFAIGRPMNRTDAMSWLRARVDSTINRR
ncbi:MAG: EAL domain-containing protein [Betaproteobacteria bacterium]